jgi:hypothetical protein
MTPLRCEHESDVSRAVRTGFWPSALECHAESCPVCSETRSVTAAFLEHSSRMNAASRPPDAAHVWLEARRRARLHLRDRAAFWFRALRALTCVYVPALLVWSLSHRALPASVNWRPSFQADFSSLLSRSAETFAVTGALLAALCIAMGSWYLLREARTPMQHSPSR